MINWTRKTACGQFNPYISEDGRFVVADVAVNKGFVPEFAEMYSAALAVCFKGEAGKAYDEYCKRTGLTAKKACWAVRDELTGEVYYTFNTAKEAKAYAENL